MVTIPSEYDLPLCLQAMAAIEADLAKLTANLTAGQFQAPPRAGGWSIGYCIEHLILSGNAFLVKWDAAIHAARPGGRQSDGPFRYSWLGRGILRFAEPPYRVKVKTTRPFDPSSRRPMEETVRRFLKMHQEIAVRLSASRGLDATRVKVRSPFVSWLWYPLGLSFDLALTHERRHLWQAWQVRGQLINQERTL